MSDIAVRVENLGKRYRINAPKIRSRTLGSALLTVFTSPFDYLTSSLRKPTEEETLWALKHVSFTVKRGEVLGILGHNGAGKSTLLSILSRITLPTEGIADLNGRVGSLLQVGTGFHYELSGRENIYLNGAILGMTKNEVDSKFDEIVDFSEIEAFIDTPIKRYSSGMMVRLGLSVAIFLDPDILLIDEVLSVGDAAFRKKSMEKVSELIGEGRSVLFVSHDIYTVQRLCQRSILIKEGRLIEDANTADIVEHYLPQITDVISPGIWAILSDKPRQGTGKARFTRIQHRSDGTHPSNVYPDGQLEFILEIESDSLCFFSGIAVTIFDISGYRLINAGYSSNTDLKQLQKGNNYARISIESLHLKSGTYLLALWLEGQNEELFDNVSQAAYFNVITSKDSEFEQLNPFRDRITADVDVTLSNDLENI